MVRRRFWILSMAAVALLGGRPCLAAPLTLTGNVTADFDPLNPDVRKIAVSNDPTSVGVNPSITQAGRVSGWAVQNIWSYYDKTTDTLQVGIQTFKDSQGRTAIFGTTDGYGAPGASTALGNGKSFAVAFSAANPDSGGTPSLVAGVSYIKANAGPGIDGFTVSQYKNVNGGLNHNFGASYGSSAGSLAFSPSAAHPEAEFTINQFSKISGIDPTKGIWMRAYAGAGNDVLAGEVGTAWTKIPAFAPEVPEPAAWLAWSAVAAGAVSFRLRRKRVVS